MSNFIEKHFKILFCLILIFAFLIRLIAINQSFWLDEAIGVIAAKTLSFKELAINFIKADNHPPLYYLLLKLWGDSLGYSEISIRLLSILFSILTLGIVYKIGELLNLKKGISLLTVLLLATSPLYIYYSQEARMYSLATLTVSLSIYSFLLINNDKYKNKILSWILFSFSMIFLVLSDYVPVFLLPIFFLYAFYSRKDFAWWKKFLISFSPLLILGIFWIPVLLAQAERGRNLISDLPSWLKVSGGASLKELILVWNKFVLGRISFYPKNIYYLLIVIFSIPFIVSLLSSLRKIKKNILVWLWLIVPLTLGFVVSFLFPVFIYFRFIFVLPAFYLILSLGINYFQNKTLKIILIASLLIVNLIGWSIYIADPSQQRENWRGAVNFIETKAKENEIAIFNYPEPFAPFRWYATKINGVGVADSIFVHSEKTEKLVDLNTSNKNGVYYFEYLWELSDPNRVIEDALKKEGFKQKEVYNFNGVGIISYWQK